MSRTRFPSRLVLSGLAAAVVLLVIACGSDPSPTPEPAATIVPPPTSTPKPSPTPIPPPTATPSPTVQPAPARESYIPQGATIAIDARPSEVFRSQVMEPLLGMLFGSTGGGAGFFSEFEADTGISLRSLEFMEMYADFGEVFELAMTGAEDLESELPDLGVALRGDDIDEDSFVSMHVKASEADAGVDYEVTGYRGYRIHVEVGERSEGFAFSFADRDTLLLGTQDGIKAMLDVSAGAAPQISGEAVRALDSLGDRDFGMILLTPEGLPDSSGGGGDASGNPLAAFGLGALSPQFTAMAVRIEGRAMEVRILELYDEDSVAAAAKEYNEGTMAMMGSMFGSPGLQALIADTDIRQDGNRLSYTSSVDQSGMTAILDFLSLFTELGSAQPQN